MLFKDITVFDGQAVLAGVDVLIEHDTIAAVGTGLHAPAGTRIVNGAGRTLLPGLIDAHVHLTPDSSRQALAFGVTTQLDMFADVEVAREARLLAAERPDVADVRSASIGATAPGGHPSQMVANGMFRPFPTLSTVDEAVRFVADRIAEGSDYLKIFVSGIPGESSLPTLPIAVVAALVEAAHERGLLAVGHATDQFSALQAVRTGVDGLVHLPFDRPPTRHFVRSVADNGVFVVPTLTMLESFCQLRSGASLVADPRVDQRLYPAARAALATVMTPAPGPGYQVANATRAVRPLWDAGVPVLAGTDAGAPGTAHGASLHRELELLVAAGLAPVEALSSATSLPARCFRLPDRGRIKPGLRADLLLVDGDPTVRITDTRSILAVYRSGVRAEIGV